MEDSLSKLREEFHQEIRKVRDLFDLRRELRLLRASREAALQDEVLELKDAVAGLQEALETLQQEVKTLQRRPAPSSPPWTTITSTGITPCDCSFASTCGRTDCRLGVWIGPNTSYTFQVDEPNAIYSLEDGVLTHRVSILTDDPDIASTPVGGVVLTTSDIRYT